MRTSFFISRKKSNLFMKIFFIFFTFFIAISTFFNVIKISKIENLNYLTSSDLNKINKEFANDVVSASIKTAQDNSEINFKLFGIFPFKKVQKESKTERTVLLGGNVYSFDLKCDGVIVKQFEDVRTKNGFEKPLKNAGIKIGDVITKINNEKFKDVLDFISKIENSDGAISLEVISGNKQKTVNVFPALNLSGKKKIGLWVKDDVSATGTLSFALDDGSFFALGHTVVDFETGAKVFATDGSVKACKVIGVTKSESNKVGQLETIFDFAKIGTCKIDNNFGVSGQLNETPQTAQIKLASDYFPEIGKAQIFCDVGDGAKFYSCEIIKVSSNQPDKNLTIRITDKTLLEKTGGIVQGMSGSPIVQNEKLVGILTHSFVNNPKVGFAVLPSRII